MVTEFRRHYPHYLPDVTKDWLRKRYPRVLERHVKATVVFGADFSYKSAVGTCTCGYGLHGGLSGFEDGRLMREHIAYEIGRAIIEERALLKKRQQELRLEWRRKNRIVWNENAGKVSPRGRHW